MTSQTNILLQTLIEIISLALASSIAFTVDDYDLLLALTEYDLRRFERDENRLIEMFLARCSFLNSRQGFCPKKLIWQIIASKESKGTFVRSIF